MRTDNLPNFFIIGAAKAGTTSLYEYIRHHPDVYLSDVKEPHYFCNDAIYAKGLEYYTRTYFAGSERYVARGEATPHYLYYEKAASRMAAVLPESHQRFIVILRDPVERAYSLYWNMVGEGHENRGFTRALEEEEERSRDRDNEYYGRVRFQYYGSGLYAHQLKTYYKYFSPDKFLVLLFEDLRSNHEDVVRSVYRFLRISDDVEIVRPKTFNSAGKPKSAALQSLLRRPNRLKKELGRIIPFKVKYKMVELLLRWNRKSIQYPPMAPEIKAELRARFRDDVIELEEIIGRELPNWKSV